MIRSDVVGSLLRPPELIRARESLEALDGFDRSGGWAIPFRNEAGEELNFKRPVVVEKLS
jgi:hypothetical protein